MSADFFSVVYALSSTKPSSYSSTNGATQRYSHASPECSAREHTIFCTIEPAVHSTFSCTISAAHFTTYKRTLYATKYGTFW
jgi:hypothetical protein